MKLKLDRIISIATLIAAIAAIVLVLKRPASVPQPLAAPTVNAANSQSVDHNVSQSQQPSQQSPQGWQPTQAPSVALVGGSPAPSAAQASAAPGATQGPKTEASASDAISAALAQSLGAAAGGLSPDSNVGSSSPNIKDQQVTVDGDVVHGKFLTEIGGKDVWVTVSGHMGEKDGYATFDPTEFKVGDVEVPVSLVNPLLQKKLAEERDRVKMPASQ
jgi:hypothetical protein